MDEQGRANGRAALAGLVISLISLAVAITSVLVSRSALSEERDVSVFGSAFANAQDESLEGFGIRVTLVNESLRPIIVTFMDLTVDGTKISEADAYLPDTRTLDQADLEPDRLALEKRNLPFSIDARSARTVGVLFDFSTEVLPQSAEVLGAKKFCNVVGTYSSTSGPAQRHPIELQVGYEPNESVQVLDVEVGGAMTPRFSWFASLVGPLDSPQAIDLTRKLTEPSSARRVRLTVWRFDGPVVRRSDRVMIGSRTSRFPFKPLPRGIYLWAAEEGNKVAVGGTFEVPLEGRTARGSPFAPFEPAGACERYTAARYPPAQGPVAIPTGPLGTAQIPVPPDPPEGGSVPDGVAAPPR